MGNYIQSMGLLLQLMNFKDDLIECKCLFRNKNFQPKCDEKLKESVLNKCKVSNHDSNNFILLFWKGVYLYEYAFDWEKFNETSLPEKEDFYSHLNMGNITDADYAHAKRVCKDFEIKHLGEYHDLYIQRDMLLLADVFENLQNMCLETYELDLAKSPSAAGLACHAAWRKLK